MKPGKSLIINLSILTILALIGAACQSATPAATQSPAEAYPEPYPVETVEPYVPPEEAAPLAPAQVNELYPGIQDGAEVTWTQAVAMLENGEVVQVMQTHDLKVYLTFWDGRTLVTIEPEIDEINRAIQDCGDPCKDILIATE
jgi:glucose/arabinose dehydrogenase